MAAPAARLVKIRDGLTPREWSRAGAMAAAIVGLNVLGWGLLSTAVGGHYRIGGTQLFGFGTGILAYTLGIRHAFDADHIAAIDNSTRKLVGEGRRPLSVGFFFSLGHCTIVFALTVLLSFGIRALNGAVTNSSSGLHEYSGIIGPGVSGAFLYLIGALNLVVLVSIMKVSREMRRGTYSDRELERQLDSRGLMNRVFGGYAKRIDAPWKMYPVGALFGLGFDTATEVALLVLAGTAVVGGLPFYAVLSLPVLFAAGMCLFDTADGCFMNFAYDWAFARPVRKVFYNLTITGLSVFVALFIGSVEILGLIGRQAGLTRGFWAFLQNFNVNEAGFVIVGMFILTWVIAWSVWHFGKIEQKRYLAAKVRNQRRLALADEASARIGTTLDITRTAEELLEVAIPRLADAGGVDLLSTVIEGDQHAPQAHDPEMRFQQTALRWPADLPPLPEYLRHAWSETDPEKLIRQRLAAGLPVFLPAFGAMTEEQIKELASGTAFDRVMTARRAGVCSLMVVPLMARGVIMGIVVLSRRAGSRPFTAADLALARDFVSRAAVCIDNARLYTRERASALALQRGLLPRHIPQVAGLDLACRYVPAQAAAEIGGDWFDVIPLPEGRCALTVGDVTGHDMRAASLMGQLRTATRTLATLDLAPADLLTRLDQITADLTDAETSATCLYAICDPGTGSWDIASAGHPPPAIARRGHRPAFPRLPVGLPLGTSLADGPYQSTRLRVPPASTLVLYTDGLIEDPAASISTGMARLARTLKTTSQLSVSQACDLLLATLAPRPADDIAILMART